MELESLAALQLREAPVLERDVVGVVHVVDAADLVPLLQEEVRHLGRDEAGSAGYEVICHVSTLPPQLPPQHDLDRLQQDPEIEEMEWCLM